MISRLRGTVVEKHTTTAVIECGGVGYGVMVSVATAEKLPAIGEQTILYTLLIPREDELQLFGFATVAEREVFMMLTTIPGIGAKTSLGILSAVSLGELRGFVMTNNLLALQKLPGVGKKTAERLLVELRDRAGRITAETDSTSPGAAMNLLQQEAIAALTSLGYARQSAEKAVKKAVLEAGKEPMTAEQLIKKSLKFAGQ